MKKRLQKISFKKSIAAAAIISFSVTSFLEVFMREQFEILISHWIASIFGIFMMSYVIVFLFFYIILLLYHRCSSCGTKWCYTKNNTICINDEYKEFSVFFTPVVLRTNEVIETYSCNECNYSDDKRKTMYGFIKNMKKKIQKNS